VEVVVAGPGSGRVGCQVGRWDSGVQGVLFGGGAGLAGGCADRPLSLRECLWWLRRLISKWHG
jgi:hypothetical protein